MEISTNPTQYLNWQAMTQSGAADIDSGQDVPGQAADPATSSSSGVIAGAAAGSTPSSQFSPDMLSQLIQAQTDQATGSTDPNNPLATQAQGQAQGAHHGHHGHHHHGGGAVQADASTDPTAATDPTDPSAANPSQGQSLAATLLS